MITEWYFCNCLGSTPRAVNAFLCALETLENSESDLQLRHLSIEELQRMDVWMQIYAFAWIFSIRHKSDNTPHLDNKIKKYFHGLVETMPEDVENDFFYLINQVFSGTSLNHKLIGAIEACAEVCKKLPDRYVTLSTPYLDSKDFLPEIIILSVVADNCKNNQNFAADFSALLATDNSSFKQLLQNALEYKYGRLALRLAIRVLTLVSSDYSRIDLLSLIWKFPTAPFEPDLLQSTAEILFQGEGAAAFASERSVLQRVKEEVKTLSELRKLTQNRKFDSTPVLRRLDLESIEFRDLRISIIFWHCVLWEIGSRLDPVSTADFLSELWTFPKSKLREAITVKTSFDRANSSRWIEQLKALSSLQGQGVEINWKRSQTTYLSQSFNWVFFSPWVKYQEWARNENPEFRNLRYPDALKPEVLVRLTSAVHIATRLLVTLPPDNPNRQNLTSLIAHGASVLSNFQKWLNDFDKENKTTIAPQLIKAVTGFALFARRQATMVGTGKLASIAPVEFVEIIRQNYRFEDGRQITSDEKQFTEKILPAVLFNWIQDAYPSIIFSGNSSRWLDSGLILEIFDYFSTVRKNTIPERLLPNLIVRFLCPECYTQDAQLNWMSAKDKKGEMEWRIPARQLLLTEQRLSWKDWQPDWYEPLDWESAGYQLPTYLVRSVERVASLKNSSDVPADISDAWIKELFNLLYSIDRARELDRFVRLRLLELIDEPVLKDSIEEQELISLMLLEYGSVYDLKLLFERIFFSGENSDKVNVARMTLQSTLLLAMNRELEAEAVKFRQLRAAQDPRLTLIAYQKSKLIEETIVRLVYSELDTKDNLSGSNLRQKLRRSRMGAIDARVNSNIRSFEADVTSLNQKKTIVLPETAPNIQEWAVQAVVNNPNSLKATIFFADFNLNGVDNLFENPNLANAYGDGKVRNVVANIVHIIEGEEDTDKYFFSCGFVQPLWKFLRKDSSRGLKIYDYVSLPIQQQINRTTGKPEWRIKDSFDNQIKPLSGCFRPNDVKNLTIEESFRNNNYSLQVKDRRKRIENIDRRIWNADVSRRFQSLDERQEYSVFAKLNEDGKWTPLDLDLTDLLLSFSTSSAIVLSFMGEMPGEFGEPTWRFSSRPGENYVIRQNQFVAGDAEKLAKKISELQKLDSPDGLLINVEPVTVNDTVYLKLSNSHPVGEAAKFYQQLETPFDERNIQWRILFKKDENPIAEKDDYNSWYYYLEDDVANGYPRRIKVEWERRHIPRQNEQTAEFIPSKWDFWAARIRGEHPWQNEINLGSEPLEDFVDRWLNLKRGDRLTLKQVIGKAVPGGDGFVGCLTRENLLVNVQFESLSLVPIESYDKPAIEEPRAAEVIDVWGRETFPLSVDYASIAPEVLSGDYCEGILIGVPDKSQGEVCKIAWITNDGIVKQEDFRIENLNQLKKIRQGSKVTGTSEQTGWRFEAIPPYVRVRALWTRETRDDDDDLSYTTPIFCDDGKIAIFKELSPGRFILHSELEKTRQLSPDGRTSASTDGLDSDEKAENVAKNTYQSSRAVLLIGDKLLFGDCSRNAPSGDVLVSDVKTTLKSYSDGSYALNRVFNLRKAKTVFRHREENYTQRSKENFEELLLKYLQSPYDLSGIRQKRNDKVGVLLVNKDENLMVPTDADRTEWSSWVELSPQEGQFVVESFYSDEAVFRLFEDGEGRILASFRRVPALTPEEFFISIGEKFNEPIQLDDRLFYVGPEEINEFTSERHDELHFRFEMGYGKTLLIPNRQLRYNNGKFSEAQFVLFHGDIITGITFLSSGSVGDENAQSEEALAPTECIININEINLQFSLARTLFSQRARYKIIHLLHAISYGDRIEIKFVEGFDESNLSERLKSFDRIRANLTSTSQFRLLQRIPEAERSEEKEIVFLGRLDEERFKSSFGKELYFEHIRLSFGNSGDGPPLQNDERVFLRATEIIEMPNDLALTLAAPRYLAEADIGKDFRDKWKRVFILRRRFSVRENLLKRILKQKGEKGLTNRLLLTRLWEDNGTIYTDIINKAPIRRVAALSGEIAKEGILLAAIAKVNQDNSLILEMSPGIFVRIEAFQISSRPEDLQEGSIVKVENAQISEFEKTQGGDYHYKFAISNAAFSDARYIPAGLRPAVMLPQNSFLKETIWDGENVEQDVFWLDKKSFTIGGLPNITALPGYFDYQTERWQQPPASEFIKLMETPHPKLVGVGFDSENFRIKPLSENAPVGTLQLGENNFYVWFISIADSVKERLFWQDLTFGDESVKEIIERAEGETWEFHDETTGHWSPADRTIPKSKLNPNNIWSGPLFFEISHDRTIKLRYSAKHFLRFGFPVEELIQSLNSKQKFEGWYTVAGVSDKGGLWLELAPGRITELPANSAVLRSKRKTPIPLTDFYWWGIETGDKVKLKKWAKNPFTIDQLELKDWLPGPRKAFGPKKVFLPVDSHDFSNGALILGKGEFKLKIPVANPHTGCRSVMLKPDNSLTNLSDPNKKDKRRPSSSDVVLLGLSSNSNPVVLGLNEFRPLPVADDDVWYRDPLARWIVTKSNDYINLKEFSFLLQKTGGALPVTVEKVDEKTRTIFFSRRYQVAAATIPQGKFSLARVLGLLDKRTVLLRCGGGLIKMPIDQVVSGLTDESLLESAAEFLSASQTSVWISSDENNNLSTGLGEETSREIIVESISYVNPANENKSFAGLICRAVDSLKLYWLPQSSAAWSLIPLKQLHRLFNDRGSAKVRIVPRSHRAPQISVLNVQEIKREFDALEIGKEMAVRLLEPLEESDDEFVVESLSSKVLMTLKKYGQETIESEILAVEVITRNSGSPISVTVAPLGQRPYHLDLPSWINNLSSFGNVRDEMSIYKKWRSDSISLSEFLSIKLPETDDNTINQILVCAYYSKNSSAEEFQLKINVAREWIRRNSFKDEIFLPYGIMASLLLNKCASAKEIDVANYLGITHNENVGIFVREWRDSASKLLQNLGKRSLRSIHVETLSRELFFNKKGGNDNKVGLWRRLEKLTPHVQNPLSLESMSLINHFCNAVELRNELELKSISCSLAASLGRMEGIWLLRDGATKYEILKTLIDVSKTLYSVQSNKVLWLQPFQAEKLNRLLAKIEINEIDITLLNLLPLQMEKKNYD